MTDVKIVTTAQAVVDPDGKEAFILKKGEQVNLTRLDPTLKRVMVGVGWDVVGFESEAPDLDVSLFMLDKTGQTRIDEDFVFYNNLKSLEGSVEHMGDNRTGAGDGDDENMLLDLMGVPFEISKIAFVVSIYDAAMRNHTFKNVRNCFLRIVNQEIGVELMRFSLDHEFQDAPKATAVIVGTLERAGPDWFFEGQGTMVDGGLPKVATDYGIVVAL